MAAGSRRDDWLGLAQAAADVDGHWPINESSRIAIRDNLNCRVALEFDHSFAIALGDQPVEFVVHPDHRRQGIGSALLERLLGQGETSFWSHGNLAGAQALAKRYGLEASRTLLTMSRSGQYQEFLPRFELRTFSTADTEAILRVNARAFIEHPEQGSMDREDFERRMKEPWFEAAGLILAFWENELLGFHWTKVIDGIGEVYVIAVDPAHHGKGIGQDLLHAGLNHMSGYERVDLYVEADNESAVDLYKKSGFEIRSRDVNYRVQP